jgi:RHS repeat-associated protein
VINYIFLDEQFKYAGGGWSRVGAGGTVKQHWTDGLQNINVPKNGYVFVYVSKESNFDVFFDNLQVVHKPGPLLEETHYYPFGLSISGISSKAASFGNPSNKFKFNSKEEQREEFSDGSGLEWSLRSRDGARKYGKQVGRFFNVDPLATKYPSWSPYAFVMNNPINLIDPDGREPIKPLVGTAAMFRTLLDNSPRKVGGYTGSQAGNYLKSLGNTEFSWKQMRPIPTKTGYFNQKEGRYIYTEKGGWVDMAHFMFYAGKAYQFKLDGKENPIGEAVQDGYKQEMSDKYAAKHSAYSYEDLPSDKFGAEFAVKHFDPNSKQTFGEQLENYLNNVLKATDPKNAPNYDKLPTTEPDKPSRTNTTTTPVYTKENE